MQAKNQLITIRQCFFIQLLNFLASNRLLFWHFELGISGGPLDPLEQLGGYIAPSRKPSAVFYTPMVYAKASGFCLINILFFRVFNGTRVAHLLNISVIYLWI